MIVENEYGKVLILATGVDISTNTALKLTITRPDGSLVATSNNLTAPAVDVTVDGTKYLANQYASYILQNGDITDPGEYKAKLEVTFADKGLRSELTRFSVSR